MAAIERQRQDMVDVHGDLPSRQREAVCLEDRLGAGRQCGGAQRERQVNLVAGSNQHGAPLGVPDLSVVRLTAPTAA